MKKKQRTGAGKKFTGSLTLGETVINSYQIQATALTSPGMEQITRLNVQFPYYLLTDSWLEKKVRTVYWK